MARAVRESLLDPPSEQRRRTARLPVQLDLAGADLFVELSRQIRSTIATQPHEGCSAQSRESMRVDRCREIPRQNETCVVRHPALRPVRCLPAISGDCGSIDIRKKRVRGRGCRVLRQSLVFPHSLGSMQTTSASILFPAPLRAKSGGIFSRQPSLAP
jgi:hypothetical protein